MVTDPTGTPLNVRRFDGKVIGALHNGEIFWIRRPHETRLQHLVDADPHVRRGCASPRALGFDSVEVTVSEGWRTDVMLLPPGEAARWRRIAADAGVAMTSLTANVPVLVEHEAWRAAHERLTRSVALAAELGEPGQRMPVSLTASGPPDRLQGFACRLGGRLARESGACHRAVLRTRLHRLADGRARCA